MRSPSPMSSALAATALLVAAGCGPAAEESPPSADPAETSPVDGEEEPTMNEENVDEGLREEVDQAVADLTDQRGVTPEEVEVLRAERVQWPDGAMGCPKEGEVYTQAIVPGYLIVLRVQDEEFYYHGAEGEPPFHCEDPDGDAVPES